MADIQHLFLDRDGVVIEDRHYLSDPDGVRLLPGVAEALVRMRAAGIRLYLVSNQSGIGRGYFTERDCLACQERLDQLLAVHGVVFEESAYCPHAPEDGCYCRKPLPGMWLRIAQHHGLCPELCAMVGDKGSDIAFGKGAGFAATVLVLTGHGAEQARKLGISELPDRPGLVRTARAR